MGKSAYRTPSKEFGEPLKYDPTFRGPLGKRSCTDVICLLLFLVFVAGWVVVGVYAFIHGDPVKIITPVDSKGLRCGVDAPVRDKPYLFFFDLTKCLGAAALKGCKTPQVCVKECPKNDFLLDRYGPSGDLTGDLSSLMICQDEKDNAGITNFDTAYQASSNGRCARYYLNSKEVSRRCIPKRDLNVQKVINVIVQNGFELLYKVVGNITNDAKYHEAALFYLEFKPKVRVQPILEILKTTYSKIPVNRRCLPSDVQDVVNQFENFAPDLQGLLDDVGLGAAYVNALTAARELGQKIVQDLDESWPFVVGGLGLAMVLCLIYIVLMRWFAGLMVWLSLIGVIGLLGYCCYACYAKYDEMKTAEERTEATKAKMLAREISINADWFKDELNEILAMKDTWLVFLVISAIALLIVLLLVIFLRKRIRIAIALIKEASKAVASITSTLVFPLFPWLLQLLVIGWFIAVLLYLAGSSVPVHIAIMGADGCTCNNITDGSRCDPDKFSACQTMCGTNSTCAFGYYEKSNYIDYLHAYNIFGVFWGLFFISGLGDMILAATFATWYWTFKKKDVPFLALTKSIGRTFRYNLGTIAFGSLILAICRMIRVILEYMSHKLKKYDNAFVKAILCCLKCFFWCLEKFIKFINKNAYIMCAVHGKNFCRSAKDAFSLLMRNVIRVFVLDKVTDFLLFLGKLLITAGMCALSFFVFTKEINYYNDSVPTLNYSIIPVIFIGFGTYFIASIFFGVYSMAVDTLFLCFLEDCERNDGSAEKPYFMSKELMKILHKKNK